MVEPVNLSRCVIFVLLLCWSVPSAAQVGRSPSVAPLTFPRAMALAAAQTPKPTAPAPPAVPPFVLQTGDGDYRIQVGALVQFDGRFVDDLPGAADTFLVRRARVPVQGRIARMFEFSLNPDFANNAVNIRDAYVDTRFSDAFRVRVGKAKAPFGLERLQSVGTILFVERAFPTALVPDRDTGIQVHGSVMGDLLAYAGAFTNGTTDGRSTDADTNDGKDVTGRLVVRPFAGRSAGPWSGLGVALAASRGEQPRALPEFRSAGQQTFFTYAADAEGAGDRVRYSPQVFLYAGPVGAFGEYVSSTGDAQRAVGSGVVRAEVEQRAWQVAVSWVLTGESATDRGVRPRANVDPGRDGWGALQIAARYSELQVGRNALTAGLSAAGVSRTAGAWAVGANWYLNPFVKWMLNVERTVFDDDPDGPRPAEHALLFRGQLMF